LTTPGDVSHQAIEDISLMRGLPNMTVIEVGDASDIESVLDLIDAIDGPVYLRMLRGSVPRLFDGPLEFNRARFLQTGSDICVLSSGICTEEALEALQALEGVGPSNSHLHITTLKPFSDPTVIEAVATASRGVITFENHSIIGGLGSATAELMSEHGVRAPLIRLGIQDTFAHGASREYLMDEYGLTASALIQAIETVVGERLCIDGSPNNSEIGPGWGGVDVAQPEAL